MGVATGDYDNDGWIDLYVTNLGPTSSAQRRRRHLQRRHGRGGADDGDGAVARRSSTTTATAGSTCSSATTSTSCGARQAVPHPSGACRLLQPPGLSARSRGLFRNEGDGTFEDVSTTQDRATKARGLGASRRTSTRRVVDLYVANDAMAEPPVDQPRRWDLHRRGVLAGAP